MFGGLALVMGAAIGTVFPTPETRIEVNKLVGAMPASMINLFGNATLMGDKLGHDGRLRHLEVRGHVQPWLRVLVDPRPVRHARRRGRPRQPRHRRDVAVRQAPDRAREAGRPPRPAVAGGAGGRGHARRELERLRRRGAGRPDPARRCAGVRALGRRHRHVLRRDRVRARPAAGARRLGGRRRCS